MILQSLLNAVDFSLLEQGYQVGLDWLGQFARVIIEGVGIIGLGIIVFTLVLKAITLPFDIYQRVKMRKQTLIMKDMKEDLEKLQHQYANDSKQYNEKMAELYKKNGYSMFGACLPMILSLIILIVAFQGFRTYSQYANLDMFVNMSNSYNAVILEHGVVGPNYSSSLLEKEDEGKWIFATPYRLHNENFEDNEYTIVFEEGKTWTEKGVVYTMYRSENNPYLEVKAEDESRYLYYYYNLSSDAIVEEYQIDTDKLLSNAETKSEVDKIIKEAKEQETPVELSEETACLRYVVKVGSTAAKTWYQDNSPSFLWIKNVWYPDVSYNHPIPDYKTFSQQLNVTVTLQSGEKKKLATVLTEPMYNNLTSELAQEKSEPNGYFILIVLSIGFMVLSQFVSMRSQKESNQYQTVDGRGASTQKMMLIIMPLMYAFFAFTYSAAFSIYMTMSSVISLVVTLLSNFALGRTFKKKEEEKIKVQYGRKLEWMEKNKEKEDKSGKKRGRK